MPDIFVLVCITIVQQLLNEQTFQYDRWQHIVNFTFVFQWYQYDLLSLKYQANEWKISEVSKLLKEGKATVYFIKR